VRRLVRGGELRDEDDDEHRHDDQMRVGCLTALLVAAFGALAGNADARELHALGFRACIEDAGLEGCGTGAVNEAPGLDGARAVAVSPDGRSVYVASSTDDSVSCFDRAADGTLTPAGCFEDTGLDGCGTGAANETPGLDGASGVAVSPDGRSVYVTAVNDDSVVRFDRAADGTITPVGCFEDAGEEDGCGAGAAAHVPGLHGARGIAISMDGTSVYVVSSTVDAAIVRFVRAPGGALTPAGCIEDTGLDGCGVGAANETPRLDGLRGVAVSPDGASVYVTSFAESAIVMFDRAPNGALTPAGCFEATGDDCGTGTANDVAGLDGAFGIAVSPDGASVYVGALTGNALLRFDRAGDGVLTPIACVEDLGSNICGLGATNAFPGLLGTTGVAVSSDGASVLAAGFEDSSIVGFRRFASGALEFADCLEDVGDVECGLGTLADAPGLDGANGVAVSPDGASVYVAASDDDAIVQLDREVPPICRGTAATSPGGAPVTVPLDCSDPNGDPLNLTVESPPLNGSVGAIDQANRTVVYTPSTGFVGSDVFSVAATGDGKESGPATVVVEVGTSGTAAPAGPVAQRLLALLASDRYRVRSGRVLRVRFAVSGAGRIKLELRKRSRSLARKRTSMRSAGVRTVKLYARRKGSRRGRRLAPGKYVLRLTVTGDDGQSAIDTARLRVLDGPRPDRRRRPGRHEVDRRGNDPTIRHR
jgi:DNA-binding beta-propeller fold protein YncE